MAEATETTTTETTTNAVPAPSASLLADTNTETTSTETTDTETTEETNSENYLGSYKTREDAEKGFKELQAKLRSKTPNLEVPETYEFKELIDSGAAFENEEHQANVSKMLKDAGVPQAMVGKLGPLAKDLSERSFKLGQTEILNKIVAAYGEPLDSEAEGAALREAWGENFDSEMAAVKSFKEKLDPVLFRAPLDRSAAGLRLLREFQKLSRGADFITDSDTSSGLDHQGQLSKIIADPQYRKQGPEGERLRAEADRISALIK